MSQAKTNARRCAVQALYQWQMSGDSLSRIEIYFLEEDHLKGAQKSYFSEIFHGVPGQLDVIDTALAEFTDRPMDKIDPVERAILRVGAYELIYRLETPYRVIINEAVNLAKAFGAEGSHKYVNGILDKVAQKQRAVEIAAKAKSKGENE
ncbi:MAG: transcription antitermination factor NusB [Methylomonas sp.]|nr:transcription antitermination factor NusB [Methylomonas sp.]PPD22078.1 MAG: transcription antitermination factor NusB [Methylomonas sp.]PPD26143.1 MAG: transcription antitermination factor NusB [Methylomonas sp.]PPD37858.1 MAG: transcription antitermination factor NusB [Methylomonas sp.]PPD42435.1 MAG: transcription antitermination factor NusB [Methylomonas sp.]